MDLELYLPGDEPKDIGLSAFRRLSSLQELILEYCSGGWSTNVFAPSCVEINCTCPSLKQLVIEDEFTCCSAPGSSLALSLPQVNSLAMIMDRNESGGQLAAQVMHLPALQRLLLRTAHQLAQATEFNLTVLQHSATSGLKQL